MKYELINAIIIVKGLVFSFMLCSHLLQYLINQGQAHVPTVSCLYKFYTNSLLFTDTGQ